MKIHSLKTNGRYEPMSLDDKKPLFSYKVESDKENDKQTARRIEVLCDGRTVYDSGKETTDQTLNAEYGGEELLPHKKYYWRVTVWNKYGESCTSELASFHIGFLGDSFKSSSFVTVPGATDAYSSYKIKKHFGLKDKPSFAVMFVYSPALFDLYVNGALADDRRFTPAAAPNKKFYETYDVTEKLLAGDNVLGVVIGDGYNKESFSRYGWVYSGEKSLIAELHVKYADGTEQVVGTDETWLGKRSRDLIENSIYDGETFDARNSRDWLSDDEYFSPVILGERSKENLLPNQIPPIRVEKYIEYKDAWINKDGKVILDFGENIAGFVRVKVSGKRGDKITIRHAEEIYKDTRELDFYTNRLAKATDTYILSGDGEEIFEPRFTYHGFRYAEIEGINEIPKRDAFCAAFMHADLERTLDFECDDADINKLFDNASRSMRGNSVSYPTDCTMRDERTPCIMDEVCYVKYGAHFWDTSSYVKQFVRNLIRENEGNPGWDGGQVTVIYKLYRLFGDKRVIEELYPSMLKFVEHCAKAWPDGIPDKMFGDWCAPTLDNPSADYETAFSAVAESGAALGYLQAKEVREMALLLGKSEDAEWLEKRMQTVKESYDRAFLNPDKSSYSGKTVVSVLPVAFGITDEEIAADVIKSVAEKVKSTGHLDTGIYGTRYLPTVLGKYGHLDTALDALFAKTYPGFGYEFDYGATTLWEQWYEYGNMSSHNHAMFSGACTFIIENLMGIKDSGFAFDKLCVKPDLTARVSKMSSSLNTVRGKYEISCDKTEGEFTYKIKVPFGCEVNLTMPDGKKYAFGSGEHVAVAKI